MAAATMAPSASVTSEIALMNSIMNELDGEIVERRQAIEMMARSIIARVHGVLIGTAGIAKSMLTDSFCERITDVVYFSEQMRKDLSPIALFGPISIEGLKQDEYRHMVTGSLAEANVVNLDEVWKANGVVLNAMLKVLNERKFKNAGVWHDVPLWAAFGSSNELPTDQALMAIRDRFGWTMEVEAVKTDDGFKDILRGQLARNSRTVVQTSRTTIAKDEVIALQEACRLIDVPEDVLTDIANMRRKAEGEANLHVSPRRYGEGVRLVQAQALLNGRDSVISDDLTLFQHVLWTDVEDKDTAFELTLDFAGKVAQAASKYRSALEPLKVSLNEVKTNMQANGGQATQEDMSALAPLMADLKKTQSKIDGEIADAQSAGRDTSELDLLRGDCQDAMKFIREEIFG